MLVAEGAECVFGVMGDGNLDLLTCLAERGVRLVHARHEQNAVAMADGYAAAGGFPALCSVTHGPGLTQTGTSLAVATVRRSPLLLLAGDTPTTNREHVQNFDQHAFVRATGARLQQLRAPQTAVEDLELTFDALRGGTGPVVLNMPTDVQLAATTGREYEPSSPPPASAGDPRALDEAATVIAAAQRPVIVAGRGAIAADAVATVAALATQLEAPVVTTLLARGLLAMHPLAAGVSGGLGTRAATELLDEADCVIALGTSLSGFTTHHGAALDGAKLVLVDADAGAHHARRRADVVVQGDIRLVADALLSLLRTAAVERPLDRALRARIARAPEIDDFHDTPAGIDPRRALIELDRCLPADRFVVSDGGHFGSFVCDHVRSHDPSGFVFAPAFGTIGQGLGVAIGAAFARPGQRITLVAGDGGFLMNIQELETAVRYRLPLTIVVVNDEAYGQEFHSLIAKGLPPDEALISSPDLARVAESFGARGRRIAAVDEVASLGSWIADADGTLVVDVRVNRDVVSPATKEIFKAVRRGIGAHEEGSTAA